MLAKYVGFGAILQRVRPCLVLVDLSSCRQIVRLVIRLVVHLVVRKVVRLISSCYI